ncbi:hypothetical protein BUALT_Bualt10G0131800 [Buddleja alternifolia]|uniref:Uncharacterized protein n=1 Tax=Buddleja alternifolia TaxID=168488 RepID=A0AAV6X301_9LAMI|nr:hypothetical protein BUALT_Bualt10G0131800 [Buddleja alternifolia]
MVGEDADFLAAEFVKNYLVVLASYYCSCTKRIRSIERGSFTNKIVRRKVQDSLRHLHVSCPNVAAAALIKAAYSDWSSRNTQGNHYPEIKEKY